MTRSNQSQRDHDLRERALKLFPWICAHCGREFDGKKLSQLTVHHKDHNHDNNPADGSNWELLCIYCHDNEHARYLEAGRLFEQVADDRQGDREEGAGAKALDAAEQDQLPHLLAEAGQRRAHQEERDALGSRRRAGRPSRP